MKPIFLALFLAWAASAPCMPPPLHTSGNLILNNSNCPVRLTGINVDGMEYGDAGQYSSPSGIAGSITDTVVTAITTWHANLVRIPLSQDYWFGYTNSKVGGGITPNAAFYQGVVDNIVAVCNASNVYVDLDLHWSDFGNTGTAVQQGEMPDMNSIPFWQSVAARYANNPSVLFELYNEPYTRGSAISFWPIWLNGGLIPANTANTTSVNPAYNTPGMQGLLNTIRPFANNICIVGGLNYAFDLSGVPGNPVIDLPGGNGVVYSTHIYPQDSTLLDGQADIHVAPALAKGPVLIGEFGQKASTADGGAWDNALINWANGANSSGYTYNATAWDLNNGSCPCLVAANWVTLTANHGVPVMNWLNNLALTPVAVCNTLTPSPTQTLTPTISPSFTISPTFSVSPTITQTLTPGPPPGVPVIYPNPYSPDNGQLLRFGSLAPGTELRIYNMIGELVYHRVLSGNFSQDTWDGVNYNGVAVETGVYLVTLSGYSGVRRMAVLRGH